MHLNDGEDADPGSEKLRLHYQTIWIALECRDRTR